MGNALAQKDDVIAQKDDVIAQKDDALQKALARIAELELNRVGLN
jgi:hypothetical protein